MICVSPPPNATVPNATTDSAAETNSRPVVINSLARWPSTRPNRPVITDPRSGRKTIAEYIFSPSSD
jgi:hypothetical protein